MCQQPGGHSLCFLSEDVATRMEERRQMRNAHATLPKTCAQEAAEGISAEE